MYLRWIGRLAGCCCLAVLMFAGLVAIAPNRANASNMYSCYTNLQFPAAPSAIGPGKASVSYSKSTFGTFGQCFPLGTVSESAWYLNLYPTPAMFSPPPDMTWFSVDHNSTSIVVLYGSSISFSPSVDHGGTLRPGTIYSITVASGPNAGTYYFTAPVVASPGTFPGITLSLTRPSSGTGPLVRNFLTNRANVIMGAAPNTNRLHSRLNEGAATEQAGNTNFAQAPIIGPSTNSTAIGQSGTESTTLPGTRSPLGVYTPHAGSHHSRSILPFSFMGFGNGSTGQFSYAASLSQMQKKAAAEDFRKLGMGTGYATSPLAYSSAVDVWVEGQVGYFNSKPADARYKGHSHIAMAGVDYRIMHALIVGAMVQGDWIGQSSDQDTTVSGRGWMAGPYVSAKLMPNLFFDARVLAGTSKNELNNTDEFRTKRVLTSAKLTGSFSYGAWQVKPSAELMYFADKQIEFTETNGTVVESQTFTEGRLNFGPHISYTMVMPDKSVLQPFIELTGIWAFHRTDALTSTNVQVSQTGARGRVKGGFFYRSPDGIRVGGAASFEGGGSTDYRSVQGEARVAIPLQK